MLQRGHRQPQVPAHRPEIHQSPISGVLNCIYAILNIIEIANGTISLEVVDEAAQAVADLDRVMADVDKEA